MGKGVLKQVTKSGSKDQEGKIKIFPCLECAKTFALASNLDKHTRTVHAGEKPFSCFECFQKFAEAGILKKQKQTK